MHGFSLLLKGTPFILYGDEINLKSNSENRKMKWDSTLNCGFSSNKTEIAQDCTKNVEEELSHGAQNTLIRMYKSLSELRKENSFLFGQVLLGNVENEQIVSFRREATGFTGYIVAANVGDVQRSVNFKATLEVPDKAEVVYFDSFENKNNNDFEIKKTVLTKGILLKPGEFIVLSFSRS
jgi:glycosidase